MIAMLIRLWRRITYDFYDNACMYDAEYDMWFENHPMHPNYKDK